MHTHVCVQRFKCLVHGVFSTTCDVRCFIISKCFCIVIHVEKTQSRASWQDTWHLLTLALYKRWTCHEIYSQKIIMVLYKTSHYNLSTFTNGNCFICKSKHDLQIQNCKVILRKYACAFSIVCVIFFNLF